MVSNNNILAEKNQAIELAKRLGDPYILPDYELLSYLIDKLYCDKLYRVKTLHKLCDQIYCQEGGGDCGEGEGVLPYSVISVLYLINPRRTMPVFIDFTCLHKSAEYIIRNNAKRLGLNLFNRDSKLIMKEKISSQVLENDNISLGR